VKTNGSLRVVFDINVYLSFILGADGSYPPVLEAVPPASGNSSADALSMALDGDVELFASPHIIRNIRAKMSKAGQSERLIEKFLELLADIWETSGGGVIDPIVLDYGVADYEDNTILSLALDPAARASIIVTSDHHLLDMGPTWRGVWICTPRVFVQTLIHRRPQ
jgi:predicted nucleic acid-binding protein